MEIICLEEAAFYALLEKTVERLKDTFAEKEKWITEEVAMQLLGVKSKTTMQELRNEGKVRFSQPRKKIILYDRDSIYEYLDENARETF